eukprot:UN01089
MSESEDISESEECYFLTHGSDEFIFANDQETENYFGPLNDELDVVGGKEKSESLNGQTTTNDINR